MLGKSFLKLKINYKVYKYLVFIFRVNSIPNLKSSLKFLVYVF